MSDQVMTIGELAQRTGATVKELRRYEDLGFLYTLGRSRGNYRLFDESALWCVRTVRGLRSLGLTLAEIGELTELYLGRIEEPIGPHLAQRLEAVRERIDARMAELEELRHRIEHFEAAHQEELAGCRDFRATDPKFATRLDERA